MRSLVFLGTAVALLATSAWAQENNAVDTLDGQMQRMQQGQPAPNYNYAPAPAAREWPPSAQNRMVEPGSAINSEGSGAIPALPAPVQQAGNVPYINGGVSDEDIAALKARAHEFNLHLLVSATNGEYIGNVHLRILDGSGNPVLSLDDAGPYVYARLAPGSYTLEADSEGTTKQMKIRIPANGSVKKHFAFSE